MRSSSNDHHLSSGIHSIGDAMKRGRFTSCCISADAAFTTIRTVSQSGLNAGSDWQARAGRSPEGRCIRLVGEQPWNEQVQIEVTPLTDSTELTMCIDGTVLLTSLLIPELHDRRGLEALGCFARRQGHKLDTYIRCVREVRRAPAELPLLISVFQTDSLNSKQDIDACWWTIDSVVCLTGAAGHRYWSTSHGSPRSALPSRREPFGTARCPADRRAMPAMCWRAGHETE